MPFVLIVSGSVLVIAAIRNSQQALFFLLARDFTGPNNFIYWFLTILLIGAVGYVPKLKPVSDGFLVLVILVLFLKRGSGFFDMFNAQIGVTASAQPHVSAGAASGGAQFVSTGGGGGGISIGLSGGNGLVFGGANFPFPGGSQPKPTGIPGSSDDWGPFGAM